MNWIILREHKRSWLHRCLYFGKRYPQQEEDVKPSQSLEPETITYVAVVVDIVLTTPICHNVGHVKIDSSKSSVGLRIHVVITGEVRKLEAARENEDNVDEE
jgi:hypothetical protein